MARYILYHKSSIKKKKKNRYDIFFHITRIYVIWYLSSVTCDIIDTVQKMIIVLIMIEKPYFIIKNYK